VRAATEQANYNAGADIINFNIAPAGLGVTLGGSARGRGRENEPQ